MSEKLKLDEMSYARPARIPAIGLNFLLTVTFAVTLYEGFIAQQLVSWTPASSAILSLVALVVYAVGARKAFSVAFLVSLLPFLINWRIAVMQWCLPIIIVSTITFIYYCAVFIDAMINDISHYRENGWFGSLQWQMTLLRICFGYDMVGHFTEKLFAGSESFSHMIEIFANYHVPFPAFFVLLGGFCELGTAVGVGAGLFSRAAGVLGAIYYLVSNHIGGHELNGYTWNSKPNGGWEYAFLMAVFFISFTISGSGKFSLDSWLIRKGWIPSFLRIFVSSSGERNALNR